jgi:hypothetical protein
MMSVLLPQVPWRRFVCVLRKLGYVPQKGKAGSGRPFFNPSRNPSVVTFREPHLGQNVGPTTLREYLRKLGVAPDEFVQLLRDC